MIITPITPDLDIAANDPSYVRTPGLHMSDIYNDLYNKLEPKKYGKPRDEKLMASYMGAGMSLEIMLEEGLKRKLSADSGRPGEFFHNEPGFTTPIIFSPDLIIFNSHTRVGEIKLTWMSSKEVPREQVNANTFPERFSKYFTQIMSYCHCLETPHARLYGFFVNGNYRPPVPEFLAWDLLFSSRELRENWSMLMSHARHTKMLR